MGSPSHWTKFRYEKWFKGKPELNIVFMVGLFNRPAEAGAIEALRAGPPIEGLTSELEELSHEDWHYALTEILHKRLDIDYERV
jgi:hypothetical protein